MNQSLGLTEYYQRFISLHCKLVHNHEFNMDDFRKRLLYKASHRGMKEADRLIGDFALARIGILSESQLTSFDLLLDESDNDLLKWIMERKEVPEWVDSNLITEIINFNKEQ